MAAGSGQPASLDAVRLQAARSRSRARALALRSAEVTARAQATCAQVREGRSRRAILQHSAFARLHARMGTMAVIEQAKGIVMGQQRCGPEEAFDLLRRMSQHTNIKMHVLAAQIVEVVSGNTGGNVTPIPLAAMRHRQSQTRQGFDLLNSSGLQMDDRTDT